MKEIQVSLWEMTKEEAAALPDGTQYLVYNPFFGYYKVETAGEQSLARNKRALPKLIYLSFDNPSDKKQS